MSEPAVALDAEVVELLAAEPALLAIADAVVVTQPRRRRWRRGVALPLAAAVLTLGVGVLATLPRGGADASLLPQALAAVGRGPVVHAQIETRVRQANVVDLATGRTSPRTVAIEYWFDERRGRLRTVVRRDGVVVAELLERRNVRNGRAASRFDSREPALHPGLAEFVTGYREALRSGAARRIGRGELAGREVIWLAFASGSTTERVAIDADTYVPVLIVPHQRGRADGRIAWRVKLVETTALVEADFAPPPRSRARPFRGDVRGSHPVSSGQLRRALAWPAWWLGESWRGLSLVSLERQTLSRGYPPGRSGKARGDGVRLRYAAADTRDYLEISQAPVAEPAYAFPGGVATFGGNPIPPEGQMELVALRDGTSGAPTFIGQLRRDGVHVTIWSSSRRLCLDAARALRRLADDRGGTLR